MCQSLKGSERLVIAENTFFFLSMRASTNPTTGSWNKIEFSQYEEGGSFYYKLLLNGNSFGQCESVMSNSSPQNFENLKVYLGNPWYAPATNAKLRNVKVWSSAGKMMYGESKCDDETGKYNN